MVRINTSFYNHDFSILEASLPVPISLFSLLTKFRDVGASDGRDKVFAFLNLATEIPGLKANYRMTQRHVFERTAQMVLVDKDLTLLSHIQDPADTQATDLPSWVPDFSVPLGRTPLVPDKDSACGIIQTTPLFWLSVEDRGRKYEILALSGWHIDTVEAPAETKGCYFTRVGELALQTPKWYPKNGLAYLRNSKPLLRLSSAERAFNSVTRVEALWRTMICDVESDIYPAPVMAGFGFSDWVAAHIHQAEHLISFLSEHLDAAEAHSDRHKNIEAGIEKQKRKIDVFLRLHDNEPGMYACRECCREVVDEKLSETQPDYEQLWETPEIHPERYLPDTYRITALRQCVYHHLRSFKDDESKRKQFADTGCPRLTPAETTRKEQFETRMDEVRRGRRMFRTKKGLLGNGPKSVEAGDEVWVVHGAKVPFVLRPFAGGKDPKRFILVGEAYVHGYMDGGALREEGVKFQAFGLV
jgi:hypothetical protein